MKRMIEFMNLKISKLIARNFLIGVIWRFIYDLIIGLRLDVVLTNVLSLKNLVLILIIEIINLIIKNLKIVKKMISYLEMIKYKILKKLHRE